MAVFKNFKDDELIVSCKCGCDKGIHLKIHDYEDGEMIIDLENIESNSCNYVYYD